MSKRTISVLLTMVLAGIVAIPATARHGDAAPRSPAEMNVSDAHRLAPPRSTPSVGADRRGPGDLLIRRPVRGVRLLLSVSSWRMETGCRTAATPGSCRDSKSWGNSQAGEASAHSGGRFSVHEGSFEAAPAGSGADTPFPLSTTLPPKTSLKAASWWSMDTPVSARGANNSGDVDASFPLKLKSFRPGVLFDDTGDIEDGIQPHDWRWRPTPLRPSSPSPDVENGTVPFTLAGALRTTLSR